MSKSKTITFIAYDDKIPIGVLTLHGCGAIYAGGVFAEISELFVNQKYRSSGIGKKMLQIAKKEAQRRGWKRIEVGAPNKEEWSKTLSFYLNNGFKEIGPRLNSIV